MDILYVSLYLICFLELLFFAVKNNKKNKLSAAYMGIAFAIFFYYILIPIFCIIFKQNLLNYEYGNSFFKFYKHFTIYEYIIDVSPYKVVLSIFFVMTFILIFNIFYSTHVDTKKISRTKKHFSNKKLLIFFTYFTFIVGSISLIVLFNSLGGVINALANAEYYRSFYNELSTNIGWRSIFLISSKLITVTPFLCWYIINDEKIKQTKLKYKIILIISFTLSIFFFLFNAGRTPMIVFLLCFVYAILKKKYNIKHLWLKLIICGIVALPLLDFLDWLFLYFKTGTDFNLTVDYTKYLYEFMPPYRNILNVTEIASNYGLRYGKDFIYAFLDLIPGISLPASYENTSLFINGSNWTMLGGIPNDLITFSYLQFGFLGIALMSAFLGRFSKIIDTKLSLFKNGVGKILFSAILTTGFFTIVLSADFVTIIRSQFLLIIVIVLILNSKEVSDNDENIICDINTN